MRPHRLVSQQCTPCRLNLDRREVASGIAGKLGESFWNMGDALCNSLKIPSTPIPLPKEVDEVLTKGRVARQPGPLGSLSTELIQLIFENLLEYHEIVLFAVTCKMLLAAGVPRLTRAYQEEHAPWVNCRLICPGEFAQQDGILAFPFLTAEEKEQIKARVAADELEGLRYYASALYAIATDTYTSQSEAVHKAFEAIGTVYGNDDWSRPWSWRCQNDVRDARLITSLLSQPRHRLKGLGTEVLCNISKGEYVRANGLTPPEAHEESPTQLLARALVSQICWSDCPAMAISDEAAEKLIRGPWCGDRFFISTLEDMPEKYRKIDWKDVTARVAAFLVELDADRA
ncbi:hypothetical protein C8Q76DRAFT_614217 [Earliella scabrosa]|nr:hypothetical protein C8Q76DRAFT_614217 [Earliella scabrosa]